MPEPLEGEAVSIHRLLAEGTIRFKAPEFQRHYVWRAQGPNAQLARFWDDLERLRNEGDTGTENDSLFLGALVLQLIDPGGPGREPLYSIIDGQQRLTTLYLVFAAIAEAYQDCGRGDDATDIERQYLLSQASKRLNLPRLEPTISDNTQFRGILRCLKNPSPRFLGVGSGEKTGRMTEAWAAIRAKVREIGRDDVDPSQLSANKLDDLRDTIAERIEVVSIRLGSRHDPHEVYERLNIGGEPLKVIDLTRNEVFLAAGEAATEQIYYDHWGPFEEKLGIQHQDAYFFPYSLIRDSRTTKARMYQTLRPYWRKYVTKDKVGPEAAQAIVKDLEEYLPAYHALVGVSRPQKLDQDSWEAVRILQRLDVPSTTYPYLIQLIHERIQGPVTTEELVSAIRVVDSFVVRRMFGGFGNTGIHTIFKRLWQNAGAEVSKVVDHLDVQTVQFPSDEEFKQSVLEGSIAKSARCHYILTEYERSFSTGDLSEWDPREVTIDHLMPQSFAPGDWPGVSEEDHEALVDTWANLVPLSGKANSEKSAGNWEQTRKMMLEESGTVFKSTRAVFDKYDHWDSATIRQRAEALAAWALTRWPKG